MLTAEGVPYYNESRAIAIWAIKTSLSENGRKLLALMAEGYSNRAIREQTGWSKWGLESCIRDVHVTLGVPTNDPKVHSRAFLVRAWGDYLILDKAFSEKKVAMWTKVMFRLIRSFGG